MASNGTITNDFRTGYRLQIIWTVNSQNTSNNTSNVSATVQLVSTGSSYTINSSASKNVSLTINGITYSGTCNVGISGNQTKSLFSQTVDVPHNSDGTKTCSFSCSLGLNVTLSGTYWGTISASNDGIFDTIPRASQPSLNASSADMNTAITISTNRASTSFTHTLKYSFGSASGTIASGVTDSTTWTIPLSLANQIPNSTIGAGVITCETYNGGTLIGSKAVNFSASVPTSVVPSFTSITGAELNTTVNTTVGKYVQKLSNIRLTINGATGVYSSTISAYNINYNGKNYGSSSVDTETIGWSGNLTVIATITDSRGRIASKTLTLNALAYNYPSITTFNVSRCNSDGTANDMGTYAKIVVTGSASSLLNSTEKNNLTYILYSKARTTSTWTTIKTATTITELNLNSSDVIGAYAVTSSYDFRVDVKDKFNTTISLDVLSTGQVVMSLGQTGVGIGKIYEKGALDVGGDIYENGYKVLNTKDIVVISLSGTTPTSGSTFTIPYPEAWGVYTTQVLSVRIKKTNGVWNEIGTVYYSNSVITIEFTASSSFWGCEYRIILSSKD